jgi:Kef-type K+ transport system membrane component KefB
LASQETQIDVVFHVLATLAAIITLGYLIGRALRWFGQPPVIGEVLAGIILGPSVLGALSPDVAHILVPGPDTDPTGIVASALRAVSRLGIILYMFLVGLELDVPRLRSQAHAAIAVSHSSILLPFVLGAGLSLWLYPLLGSAEVPFTSFALFMGIAMAITAFPVLARILTGGHDAIARRRFRANDCWDRNLHRGDASHRPVGDTSTGSTT